MTHDEMMQLAALIKEATKPPLIDTSHIILGAFVGFVSFVIRWIVKMGQNHMDAQIKVNEDLYIKHNTLKENFDILQGEHNALTCEGKNYHRRKSDKV